MSDELRDRIANRLWLTEEESWEDQAQAIIDDLGLTVETRIDKPGQRGIDPVARVVGEWERRPNHTTHHMKCGCQEQARQRHD